ncbi:MAG: hypothetical protein HRT88_23345 [Lentisphaeraceae bacterium]|nr:hypothetical protein [Lentisphaeraceae bacterium]
MSHKTWCSIKDIEDTHKAHEALQETIKLLQDDFEMPTCSDSNEVTKQKIEELSEYKLDQVSDCLRVLFNCCAEEQVKRSGKPMNASLYCPP